MHDWDKTISFGSSKLTSKVSFRILAHFPIENLDINKLFEVGELEGGDLEELTKFCLLLNKNWNFLIYHHPKPEKVQNELEKRDYPSAIINGILKVYTSPEFEELVENLSTKTFSQFPRVSDTQWTTRTIVSRNGCSSGDREVTLQVTTNQGVKKIELDFEQLQSLYYANNRIQESLDSLLD